MVSFDELGVSKDLESRADGRNIELMPFVPSRSGFGLLLLYQ